MNAINSADLCPKCRLDHETKDKLLGKETPYRKQELCRDCRKKLGIGRGEETPDKPKRRRKMKRGRKKSKKTAAATGVKLDKDTKRLIRRLGKSGAAAAKLEAKAEKHQTKADELRERAQTLRAGFEALKNAIKDI